MRRLTSDTNTKTFFVDEVILKHNGHRFVTDAIFDTGATKTMIDKSIAELIDLDTTVRLGNYTEIQTADGKLKGVTKEIEEIVIGDDSIPHPSVVVVDFSENVERAMHNILVVIGADYIEVVGMME